MRACQMMGRRRASWWALLLDLTDFDSVLFESILEAIEA
jgi:hypothetical protein